jgi:hypothetical protein
MTVEERANRFIDAANPGWRLVNPSAVAAFAGAMAREIRAAEAAAAARQRAADAAACRAVLEFWDRDSPAPGPYEAGAVAAAEMCVERIMGGGPDAGGEDVT